jgi:hypothetical protein
VHTYHSNILVRALSIVMHVVQCVYVYELFITHYNMVLLAEYYTENAQHTIYYSIYMLVIEIVRLPVYRYLALTQVCICFVQVDIFVFYILNGAMYWFIHHFMDQ